MKRNPRDRFNRDIISTELVPSVIAIVVGVIVGGIGGIIWFILIRMCQ